MQSLLSLAYRPKPSSSLLEHDGANLGVITGSTLLFLLFKYSTKALVSANESSADF